MNRLLIFFLLLSTGWLLTEKAGAQNTNKKVRYNYLAFLPDSYDSLNQELFPVVLYLHGRSVSGTDLNRLKRYGLPFFLDHGKKINFIVIAPQCPWGKTWGSENWLDTLYSEVCANYRVDTSKVYLTGMSLGGFGTWELANRYPHRFAAIAPLCGGAKDEWAKNLVHLPIWVFHGEKDPLVPVLRSDQMVKALKEFEAPVTYSRLPDKGHNIHRIYNDDRLYEWFSRFSIRPLSPDSQKLKELERIHLARLQLPQQEADHLKLHEDYQNVTF